MNLEVTDTDTAKSNVNYILPIALVVFYDMVAFAVFQILFLPPIGWKILPALMRES